MSGIGIVGIGISGLQLALYLQQHGMRATLYSATPPDALSEGQAMNYAIRWAPTLARERVLGLADADPHPCARLRVRGPAGSGIDVRGSLPAPGDSTDFRIYLPRLLDEFRSRGGLVRVEPCGPPELPALQARHELVVVAVGRGGYGDVFPIDRTRSPHRNPPRRWTVATYRGLDLPPECDVEMNLVPGAGELLHMRYRSVHGVASVLAVGAIPGQAMDVLADTPSAGAPREFREAVLATLRTHAPHISERAHDRDFAPTRPLDVIQAAITPTVRSAWAEIDGRPVLAIGDAWVLNDPLAAQGANLGSRTAFTVGAAIVEGGPYDTAFAKRVAAQMWEQAEAPCVLSNVLLEPPPPHVLNLLVRAGTEPSLGDRVADGFGHPEQMLALLAPAEVAA